MESAIPTTEAVVEKESLVDPFLVEALNNPRHRLTILRMELDIQRFLQSFDQQQFEFQHFPTSYLRLAAHRVAQHYGLITMVQDSGIDGLANKIIVKRMAECIYPAVCLSEIPCKQLGSDRPENVKIVIRSRPTGGSINGHNEHGVKRSSVRSVEERKEEYDRARARIFSSPSSSNSDDAVSEASIERKSASLSKDENEGCRSSVIDQEKNVSVKDGTSSRIAIFRDREKDRTDPDYDRSYDRYVRNLPTNQSFSLVPFSRQKLQPAFVQYDNLAHVGQMPRTQAALNYRSATNPVMNPFCSMGSSQTSSDATAAYMQWPTSSMMYAHSHEQFRHVVFQQAPFSQQPLSFDYSQHH